MASFVSYERYSTDNNNNNNNNKNIIKENVRNDSNFELELMNCIKKCNEDFENEVQEKGLRGLLKFNDYGKLLPEKKSKKRRPSIKQRILRENIKRAKVQLKLLVRNRNKCIERCKAELEIKYLNLIMKQKGMDEDTEGLIGQYLLPKPDKGKYVVHNVKSKKSRKSSSKTRKSSSKTKKKSGSKSKKNKSKSPSKKKGGTKRRKKGGSKTKKKSSSK